MIIKEDLNQFDTKSQIISKKELQLNATDKLILNFKRTLAYIQNLKINIIFDEYTYQSSQLEDQYQNQQQDLDIPINHIPRRSKKGKILPQNQSSKIFQICSYCKKQILSEVGLGDNLKKKRKI
ncbi:unnamed protein product [Paramecium octaurelia]|uniref:Uncharacterized protein n=1 Tax=Paramecium octaurelia TaxID=43137 RepID=A0A8S1WYK4_PAROT|nr:unnamed protein product [Paramecium octaurelia]